MCGTFGEDEKGKKANSKAKKGGTWSQGYGMDLALLPVYKNNHDDKYCKYQNFYTCPIGCRCCLFLLY